MKEKLAGRINNCRVDPSGWIGAIVMFIFAIYAIYRWQVSGFVFFILLAFRDVAASYFLLTRNNSKETKANTWIDLLAYISSGFPFFYFSKSEEVFIHAGMVASLFAILGFCIATIALFDLGSSFGVSVANRGHVKTGIYKYVKHPMYLGYGIAELSFVLLNVQNITLWLCSISLYIWRAIHENRKFILLEEVVGEQRRET